MKRLTYFTLFIIIGILCVPSYSAETLAYTYDTGGSDWTDTCATGESQSPIDISNITGTCDNSMTIDMVLHNNDIETSILTDEAGLSSIGEFTALYAKDIEGELIGYTGTKIQVHTPSEHSIDGSSYDIELQFHHTIKDEFVQSLTQKNYTFLSTAVVSLMYNVDTLLSSEFFNTWVPSATSTFTLNAFSALSDVVDSTEQYYTYQGSYTQPDCSEDVNWYVFSGTKAISSLQLSAIKKYITGDLAFAKGHGNNRDQQSLNARVIKLGNVTCEEQFIYFFSFFILYIFINYFIFKLL